MHEPDAVAGSFCLPNERTKGNVGDPASLRKCIALILSSNESLRALHLALSQ